MFSFVSLCVRFSFSIDVLQVWLKISSHIGTNLVLQLLKKEGVLALDKDIEQTLLQGQFCLVGKIMTERKINHEAFKLTMLKVWKVGAVMCIVEVEGNLFLLEFGSYVDRMRVWDGQPWIFLSKSDLPSVL